MPPSFRKKKNQKTERSKAEKEKNAQTNEEETLGYEGTNAAKSGWGEQRREKRQTLEFENRLGERSEVKKPGGKNEDEEAQGGRSGATGGSHRAREEKEEDAQDAERHSVRTRPEEQRARGPEETARRGAPPGTIKRRRRKHEKDRTTRSRGSRGYAKARSRAKQKENRGREEPKSDGQGKSGHVASLPAPQFCPHLARSD